MRKMKKVEPRMDTNLHESGFMEKLLDGLDVEWKALGEVAIYSRKRVSSNTLDEKNYVGVDNLLQNRGGRTDSKPSLSG